MISTTDLNAALRSLPSVEEVLNAPEIDSLAGHLPRKLVVDAIRRVLDEVRDAMRAAFARGDDPAEMLPDNIPTRAAQSALSLLKPSLRRVINASGVVVHTNLGRSALADEAVAAVTEAAQNYSTLEYSVEAMARGSRHDHCEGLLRALTGAEAAIAVNNNAAAVMMVLSEFAQGHEAIVSRGELVEIGGSFRIPDIMALSRATMVEVGTTNKTHEWDYERAITDQTAMLLKVHTSNYRLIGFTESVAAKELVAIARKENERRRAAGGANSDLMVYEDLGSGAFLPVGDGVTREPTVAEALAQGCDLVSFSGDKLLGGPQAGIIVGSKRCIDRLKKNPLARALRLDKMTLAALEATLRAYLDPERAKRDIPTLRMLTARDEEVRATADELALALSSAIAPDAAHIEVVPEISRAGGGALPMHDIPTFAVKLTFIAGNAQACDEYLVRQHDIPIIARLKHDAILFDARTILRSDEIAEIARALEAYFSTVC